MTQAERPQEKPSEELQALRRRVAELEALEVQRQADTKPLQLRDEPLYKAVFESANDSLFLVDKKGNILDFNDRLTEVGGYQKEELVGKNIRSLAGKVTRKSQIIMVTNFLKRMANIRIPPYEVEMYKKNGELLTVEISARPLRKDGKIIGDLAILRDVTERKRIENEIRQKSSELQLINSINDAANRGLSLTELIQVVSEEIQNLYGGFAAITYFLNKDKQSLVARNYKFPSRMVHAIEKLIHMKMSEINFSLKEGSIHSETLKTGKAQVTNGILALQKMPEEYTDDKTLQRLLPMVVKIMGVRSVITVPLISESKAIGLLDIARHEPLTDCHPERMQTIASQFVNVIKRKQAEDEIRQKASEIQLINSFNDAANRGLSLKEIIKLMSIGIQELYGGFATTTHLLSDDKQYMESHFSYPHQLAKPIDTLIGGKIPEIKYKLKADGIYTKILNTGKVQVTDDTSTLLQMAEEMTDDKTLLKLVPPVVQLLGVRSVISVPLISEGEATGILDIARHESAIEYDLEQLQTISKQFVNVIKRKQAEEALKISEQNFRNSIDSSLMGIHIVDKDWNTLYANRAFLDIYGYANVEELKASCQEDRYTPESYSGWVERHQKMVSGTAVPDKIEADIVRRDGTVRHIQAFRKRVMWDGRQQYQLLYNDITERQQAEKALQESETRYHELANTITSGVFIYKAVDNGEDFVFVDVSSAAEKMEGINRQDIIGKRITEVLPGCKDFNLFKKFQKVWRTGNSEYFSSNWIKDERDPGKWRDNWTYKLPSGEIVNVYNDITDKKLAEEALKASEEKYSTLIEKSSDGIVILNVHSIEFSNVRMCEMSGYSQNEILGKNFLDLVAPEDLERLQASYQVGPVDGTKTENIEVNIISREKKRIPVETNAQIIVYKGRPATMVTIRDITNRKQAEEALKASEQNFRNSIDSSSLGIRISDIDNHTLYANQTLLDIFGYKNIEEVKIKAPQEFYSQESYADYLKMSEKYGCGGIILDQVDIDIIRKDGTVRHLQTVFKEVFWDGKQQYQSLYHDITENKNIEVALRESEEKYRTIFESANDILILLDAEGKILDVNKRLTEMGGYDRYELIDKNITELTHIIDEQNMAIVVGNLWKMVTTGKAVTYQVEMIKKNRELISLEINAVPLQKEGKVVGVLGILRDITERNKSELRIRESEEKYRTIFESANDILMLLDTNGKILDVNGRLTEIGGYDRYELIDKNFLELTYIIDKKNMAIVLTNLQKIVAGSGIVTYQVEMVKKNQEPIFMEINAVPVLKESKIIGVLAILRDITERRKSELLLREQKALTDRILKSTPNVVAVVGRDQRIIMVNNTFEHTFELGEGQAEGKNIGQFIPVPHLLDKISHVLTSRETQFQIEFRIKRGVVVMLWVADIISMEQNEVLIVLRDITEEREMQERLYLTDRLASVGEMAAGIAHELNNPLTGVVALSQLLLESGVPDDMRDDIVAISKEGQRAAEVVRNLLSFARSHTLSISSTDINTVIKEVLSLRAYEHNVNNIMVATNLAPDLPEIMTDRFQMQQVFLNIILNAEHAMIESNKRGNLMVTTEQNNGIVKISFANDGPAIPPNIINRIFDPFFTTNDVGKGTGLGLSICYGIVTKQGGKIYAQSQEGKGATFIVELPIKSQKLKKD